MALGSKISSGPVAPKLSSTAIHFDLKQPSIKLTSSGSPNIAAALAKHILFSRKSSKTAKTPKGLQKGLPAVERGV
jgi:hypothetical protein